MASTPQGRRLTDQHRIWQATLGTTIAATSLELAGLINPAHIGATYDHWLESMLGLQYAAWQASSNQAVTYTKAYRTAELGAAGGSLPVVTAPFDWGAALNTAGWAPWYALGLAGPGLSVQDAWAGVSGLLAGRMSRQAQTAGRNVVTQSATAHGGRWRRVADGQPCAWCAMLVTQGPVYHSAATDGAGHQYHNHCGCQPEEVFGQWQPTALEQQWIDAYQQTGLSGADAAAAMRRQPGTLFHDGQQVRNTTTSGAGAASSGGSGKPPPPRAKGMLGPDTPDEFGTSHVPNR